MFKFLKNLFRVGHKKIKTRYKKIEEDGMEIEIDMDKGSMIISTEKELTQHEIIKLFRKHMKGM